MRERTQPISPSAPGSATPALTGLAPIVRLLTLILPVLAAAAFAAARAEAAPRTGSEWLARFGKPGPYRVELKRRALCCDRKGKSVDLYLPVMQGRARVAPVVTWGNGSWASPDKYEYVLRHLASWGMVVVATRDASVGKGDTMRDALSLLTRDGPVAPLDLNRIAAVGHSQGAGGAVNAAIGEKGGIKSVIAIDLPARNLCGAGDCDDIPYGLPPRSSILFLSGEKDPLSAPDKVKSYFEAVPAGLLKARASVRDADHNDIQGQPGCGFLAIGCRHGVKVFLPYITAWLAWQLDIEPDARRVFVGNDASFMTDKKLTAVGISAR